MSYLPFIAVLLLLVVLAVGGEVILALLDDLHRFLFKKEPSASDARDTSSLESNAPEPALAPGAVVETLGPLRPAGVVMYRGTQHEARSETGYVSARQAVRVIRMEGNVAIVRRCDNVKL